MCFKTDGIVLKFNDKTFDNLIFSDDFISNYQSNTQTTILEYEKKLGVIDDKSILYKYNNYGMRCEDFKVNHEGKHILFAGCSYTEGASIEIENVWSKIVYENILNNENASGYFSISRSGAGIHLIWKNILNYIKKFGIPDNLFILIPNIYRYFIWDDDIKTWSPRPYAYNIPNVFEYIKEPKHHKNPDISNEKKLDILFYTLYLMQEIESFCKILGISLIWSSWSTEDSEIFEKSNLYKNYLNINKNTNMINYCIKNKISLNKKDLVCRDGIHHGKSFHKFWAYKFYEEYQRIKDNDNFRN